MKIYLSFTTKDQFIIHKCELVNLIKLKVVKETKVQKLYQEKNYKKTQSRI